MDCWIVVSVAGNFAPQISRKAKHCKPFARMREGPVNHDDDTTSRSAPECYEAKGTNHQETDGLYGARTKMAERYSFRLRRTEIRIHHRIAGSPLRWSAQQETSCPFPWRVKTMISRKPTHFRNALDLRNKVQVKVLRRRLKLTDGQLTSIVGKTGNSISAIVKEATKIT